MGKLSPLNLKIVMDFYANIFRQYPTINRTKKTDTLVAILRIGAAPRATLLSAIFHFLIRDSCDFFDHKQGIIFPDEEMLPGCCPLSNMGKETYHFQTQTLRIFPTLCKGGKRLTRVLEATCDNAESPVIPVAKTKNGNQFIITIF